MSSLATPLAVVFLLAIASWLTLNTVKSMRNEKEIARLVSTVEALRTSSRERQDLEAATDRNLEEELRNLRAELTSGAKAIRKEIAAAAATAPTKDELTTLEGRIQAQEQTASQLTHSTQTVGRQTTELFDRLTTHQQESLEVHARVNDTTYVLQALVAQVVAFKEEYATHAAHPVHHLSLIHI